MSYSRRNLITKIPRWKRYVARKCCSRDKQRVVQDWLILAHAVEFRGDLPRVKRTDLKVSFTMGPHALNVIYWYRGVGEVSADGVFNDPLLLHGVTSTSCTTAILIHIDIDLPRSCSPNNIPHSFLAKLTEFEILLFILHIEFSKNLRLDKNLWISHIKFLKSKTLRNKSTRNPSTYV